MTVRQSFLSEATQSSFGNKTRGKILSSSLDLFNTDGFDRVTTARIAEKASVLEGTLWYHFKAKHDLVIAHLDSLEERLDTHLEVPMAVTPEAILQHFYALALILSDFRYLLRDPIQTMHDNKILKVRLQRTYTRVEDKIETRLRLANDEGLIDLTGANIHRLAVSCFVIGRYWLDYAQIRFIEGQQSQHDIEGGIMQILTVLRPYMTRGTLQKFNTLDIATLVTGG